jgi:hypothetical protein
MKLADLFVPVRSVAAGGLSGLAAWGLIVLAKNYGIDIPEEQATAIVGGVTVFVTHIIPDTVKQKLKALDLQAQDLAKLVPDVKVEHKYPKGKNGV